MVERVIAIPRRRGVWVALLALALQLGLSIGHVHEIGPGWGSAAAPSHAKPMFVPAGEGSPAGIPAIPAEDQCPICFSLAVSGTFILALALPVVLASVLGTARIVAAPQPILLARRRLSPAQQRAPPPVAIPA